MTDLKMGSVQSCSEALYFPEREREGVPEWARPRKDKLLIHCDSMYASLHISKYDCKE
jgi:hypothetical protein